MVVNIHLDALYLSKPHVHSRVAGHYSMRFVPKQTEPIPVNGNIYVICRILKFVVALAAEAELCTLFMTAKEVKTCWLILQELDHIQPTNPIHCNNKTVAGIANDTVEKHQSQSMDMSSYRSQTKSDKDVCIYNDTQDKKTQDIIPSLLMKNMIAK